MSSITLIPRKPERCSYVCSSVVEAVSNKCLGAWKVMKRLTGVKHGSKLGENGQPRVIRNARRSKVKNGYCGRKRYATYTL